MVSGNVNVGGWWGVGRSVNSCQCGGRGGKHIVQYTFGYS